MQEARPESQARRVLRRIAHPVPRLLQRRFISRVHRHVRQQREVISRRQPRQETPQHLLQRLSSGNRVPVCIVGEQANPVLLEARIFLRQRSLLLVLRSQSLRDDLARLHVRLVKRIDPDHRPRHRRRNFPAEVFLPDLVRILHLDAHHRHPGLLQRVHLGVLLRVGRRRQPQIDEQAIASVLCRRADRLAVHRDDPLAVLARAFRDQLLQPRADIVNSRRREHRHLVVPAFRQRTEDRAQQYARILARRDRRPARLHHLLGALQEFPDVDSRHRRRRHPEIR